MIELLLILGVIIWSFGTLVIFFTGFIWSGNGVLDDRDFTEQFGTYRGTLLNWIWFLFSVPLWPITLIGKGILGVILGW